MPAILSAVLALLQTIAPSLGSSAIQNVINILVQLLPVAIKEVQDLTPAIKNIIAALSSNPAATADQLATLKALDTLTDANFDAAADKAQAEDAAAQN